MAIEPGPREARISLRERQAGPSPAPEEGHRCRLTGSPPMFERLEARRRGGGRGRGGADCTLNTRHPSTHPRTPPRRERTKSGKSVGHNGFAASVIVRHKASGVACAHARPIRQTQPTPGGAHNRTGGAPYSIQGAPPNTVASSTGHRCPRSAAAPVRSPSFSVALVSAPAPVPVPSWRGVALNVHSMQTAACWRLSARWSASPRHLLL